MKLMQSSEQNSENDIQNIDMNEADARVYEVGYLLVPTIEEGAVVAEYTRIKDLVASFGGELIADDMPHMTPLAYTMLKVVQNVRSKFSTAYFGWVKFYMDPQQVIALKKKLDFDPNVIRFLVLKTVKENTLATKRFVNRDGIRRKPVAKSEGEEVVVPINKEEIDKEIDAMVAV